MPSLTGNVSLSSSSFCIGTGDLMSGNVGFMSAKLGFRSLKLGFMSGLGLM